MQIRGGDGDGGGDETGVKKFPPSSVINYYALEVPCGQEEKIIKKIGGKNNKK